MLPSYVGIIISDYKDPYSPTSIMRCYKRFERCSYGAVVVNTDVCWRKCSKLKKVVKEGHLVESCLFCLFHSCECFFSMKYVYLFNILVTLLGPYVEVICFEICKLI